MKAELHHASWQAVFDRPTPDHHRLPSPVAISASASAGVRPQVEEVERIVGAQVGGFLHEAVLAGEWRMTRVQGEVVAAVGQTLRCCSSSSSR